MSSETILFPLAADESDVMMLLLAVFILAILIILLFLIFSPWIAFLLTAVIVFMLFWAIRENMRMQDSQKR